MDIKSKQNLFRCSEDDQDIVTELYSHPELIDRTEEGVISSGEMSGIELSRYDTELWRIAKTTYTTRLMAKMREDTREECVARFTSLTCF